MAKCLNWLDSLLYVSFLALIILFPLPLGGNRAWAYLALSGACFLLLAAYFCLRFAQGCYKYKPLPQLQLDWGAFLIGFVALWMFVQASLPLPTSWLRVVAPATVDSYSSVIKLFPINPVPSSAVISLDYAETMDKSLFSLACFSFLLLMGQLVQSHRRLVTFCYVVVLSGVFQATFGSIISLTDTQFLKTGSFTAISGTFPNRDHLAGYLEMTVAVGMGLLLGIPKLQTQRSRHWRGIVRLVTQTLLSQVAVVRCLLVVMVIGLIMTQSRMGNAAFFNALLVTGILSLIASTKFRTPGFVALIISIVLVDVFIIGSIFDLGQVIDRMEKTTLQHESRDEVFSSALTMLPDFWLVGTGAGAFAYVFPNFKQEYFGTLFHSYAHNDYMQILLELGFIGFIPLVGYVLLAFFRSWKLLRYSNSRMARGIGFACIMVIISLSIHSTVDFNLQIPANILLFAIILSMPRIALNITASHQHRV